MPLDSIVGDWVSDTPRAYPAIIVEQDNVTLERTKKPFDLRSEVSVCGTCELRLIARSVCVGQRGIVFVCGCRYIF